MARYFTHYWRNETCESSQRSSGTLLIVNSRNDFIRRGIGIGDFVYSITVYHGTLYLIGYIEVGNIFADRDAAAAHLGVPTNCLWQASDQLIARRATPHQFDRSIPSTVTQKLQLIHKSKVYPPKYEDAQQLMLDRQTFRGIRELTGESANLLNSRMEALCMVTASEINVWQERL